MARKQRKYHFIYRTVNQVNGKWYMGMHSTDNLEDGYIGSGKRLRYSIRKYGIENFKMEIQEFLPDRRSLKEREKEIVNEGLLKDPMCMNLKLGGEGGFVNEEHRQKAQSNGGKIGGRKTIDSNRKNINYDTYQQIKNTNIQRSGSLNGWKGKTHSQETKNQIGKTNSEKQKGEKNSQFGTIWIFNEEMKISRKILKSDLDKFPSWKRGRKIYRKMSY